MFRIEKSSQSDMTAIFTIEGSIKEENVRTWSEEIKTLARDPSPQIVLDLSSLQQICPEAEKVLDAFMFGNMYLVNCPLELRKRLSMAGISLHVLE